MWFKRKKLLTGQALKDRASELGVSPQELGYESGLESEPKLQQRVIEAERAVRESRLWMISVISALIALVSAIAAWYSASNCS